MRVRQTTIGLGEQQPGGRTGPSTGLSTTAMCNACCWRLLEAAGVQLSKLPCCALTWHKEVCSGMYGVVCHEVVGALEGGQVQTVLHCQHLQGVKALHLMPAGKAGRRGSLRQQQPQRVVQPAGGAQQLQTSRPSVLQQELQDVADIPGPLVRCAALGTCCFATIICAPMQFESLFRPPWHAGARQHVNTADVPQSPHRS